MGRLFVLAAVTAMLRWQNPSVVCYSPDDSTPPAPLHDLAFIQIYGTARWSRDTLRLAHFPAIGREGKTDSALVTAPEPCSVWAVAEDILGRNSCSNSNFIWIGPKVLSTPDAEAFFEARGGPELQATWFLPGAARLSILDVAGRLLFSSPESPAGSIRWGANPGVYFARISFGDRSMTRIVILRPGK